MRTTIDHTDTMPPVMKRSRTKLWLRTMILAVFGTIFGLALRHDIAAGNFPWPTAVLIAVPCLAIGFLMRALVPMRVHPVLQIITLSFDRIYFSIILVLVAAKAAATRIPLVPAWSDAIMCMILGLMIGRMSGICLRLRGLRRSHAFVRPV